MLYVFTRSGYAVVIVKLREAYKTIDDKIEELTNRIDTYPFKERYNNMMATVNIKVDVSKINTCTVQSKGFFTSPLTPPDNCFEPPAIPLTCPSQTHCESATVVVYVFVSSPEPKAHR